MIFIGEGSVFYRLTKHQMGQSRLVTAFNASCEVSVWICLREEMSIFTEIEKKKKCPHLPGLQLL